MDESSVFQEHFRSKHNGQAGEVDLEIMSKCAGGDMLRQATEAVLIRELKPTLNTKEEHNRNRPRKRKETNK